jgi:hypothetical protein
MRILALALPGLFSVLLFGACGSPHPVGGVGCFVGGEPCAAFSDCCSGVCNNGACQGGGCSPPAAGCVHSGDCCTKLCFQNVCEGCVGPGVPCNDNANCCSGRCNGNNVCN